MTLSDAKKCSAECRNQTIMQIIIKFNIIALAAIMLNEIIVSVPRLNALLSWSPHR